jgi:predicted ester cyclase
MPNEANEALVRRWYEEFWCQGNADAADELVDPDFIDHQALPGAQAGIAGLKEFVRAWRRGFPDMAETIELLISDGDMVVGRFRLSGTHRGDFFGLAPSGRRVDVTGIDILRIRDGKIVEFWYSEDTLGLFRQLGVTPPEEGDIPGSSLAGD